MEQEYVLRLYDTDLLNGQRKTKRFKKKADAKAFQEALRDTEPAPQPR